MNKHMLFILKTTLLFSPVIISTSVIAEDVLLDRQAPIPAAEKSSDSEYLVPRDLSLIPDTPFGEKVKLGYSLFVNSQTMRGQYVGNEQTCSNCHMQGGARANAAPLWGAFMSYPAYRSKNDKVNTYAERIQGCFTYSMNGLPPEQDSPEMVALTAYSYWLAMGGLLDKHGMQSTEIPEISDAAIQLGGKADSFEMPDALAKKLPVDKRNALAGRGFPKIAEPELPASRERGEIVYKEICASCHGANGEGIKANGVQSFPPLWGAEAFNWGAGMMRVNTAAYFIYENMPLGKSVQLTNQQAWDVAIFMNTHERPQDPRFTGSIEETRSIYHDTPVSYYGIVVDGVLLGENSYPSQAVDEKGE
ncbi:MAG: c-type cytochrome [Psychromonas sp.]